MLERVNALMETEEFKDMVNTNEEILTEAIDQIYDFSKILKGFVLEHPEEFLGKDIQETYKNVRLFSEVATSQYLTEISHLYGSAILEEQSSTVENQGIDEYL